MVIGPTPPGTGVIRPATAAASSKATSPTTRVLPCAAFSGSREGTRLMPTSTTVAPGLIQSPRIISGRPTAATRMSAVRHRAGRSRVREWAMVTVQLSPSSSWAIGLPTMLERPTITAFSPDSSPSSCFSSIRQPSGVHGTSPGSPTASRPALTTWKPSTSLSGSMAPSTAEASIWPGRGSCTRIPWMPRSAFSAAISSSSVS